MVLYIFYFPSHSFHWIVYSFVRLLAHSFVCSFVLTLAVCVYSVSMLAQLLLQFKPTTTKTSNLTTAAATAAVTIARVNEEAKILVDFSLRTSVSVKQTFDLFDTLVFFHKINFDFKFNF